MKALFKDISALFITILAGVLLIQAMSSSSIASVPSQADNPALIEGKVVETMNSGGYTYVLLDTGAEKRWIAGPQTAVAAGDHVRTVQGMPMTNFKSSSLDREFEVVYFVSGMQNLDAQPVAAAPAAEVRQPDSKAAQPAAEKIVVELVDGHSVEHLYANAAELEGTTYSLRGKVVKFSGGIMGTNWIHLQDGTGSREKANNDLVITSKYSAKTGDTIRVSGTVAVDTDIGFGYHYDVLLEDSEIQIEE